MFGVGWFQNSIKRRGRRKGKFFIGSRGGIQRIILDIEKDWNQTPGWFIGLEKDLQIDLIAHYRLSRMDPKHIQKRKERLKKERFLKQREKYKRKGSNGI